MGFLSVIRRWALRDKMPIREIARRTGLSRNTVKKYLREGAVEPQFKTPSRPSKLDPYAARLSAWLLAQTRKSRKERRNVKLMYEDLVSSMRSAIAHHEKTHVHLLQTTTLGLAATVSAIVAANPNDDPQTRKKADDVLKRILKQQTFCQEFCATYRQFIYINVHYRDKITDFVNAIRGTIYETVLNEAKNFVSNNSIKTGDIEDVFICICQSALNSRIFHNIQTPFSKDELLDFLLTSDELDADTRLRSILDAIGVDGGEKFNEMLYEQSLPVGKKIIEKIPSNSQISTLEAALTRKELDDLGIGEGVEFSDFQLQMRVRPYRIFQWIHQFGVSVELDFPAKVNSAMAQIPELSQIAFLRSFEEAPEPNPIIKFQTKPDDPQSVYAVNTSDMEKIRNFLSGYLEGLNRNYIYRLLSDDDTVPIMIWSFRAENKNSKYVGCVLLRPNSGDLDEILGMFSNPVHFVATHTQTLTLEMMKAVQRLPKVISWFGSVRSQLDQQIPGQTGLFLVQDLNRDVKHWVRTLEQKGSIFAGFVDQIEFQKNQNHFSDARELFEHTSITESELKDFFDICLEFGSVFESQDAQL